MRIVGLVEYIAEDIEQTSESQCFDFVATPQITTNHTAKRSQAVLDPGHWTLILNP